MKAWALLLTGGLVGCSAPTQYGGPIAVDPEGFNQRMMVLCRMGRAANDACMPSHGPTDPTAGQPEIDTAPTEPPR